LQFDPDGKYCHIPAQTLTSKGEKVPDSCYYIGCQEDLTPCLTWLVNNHLNADPLPEISWKKHVFSAEKTISPTQYFRNLF
jgi:hypothetical protein